MPKKTEPSKRSLREIPGIDFATAKRLPRGKYAEKARRSFAVAIVEQALFSRASVAPRPSTPRSARWSRPQIR